MFRNWRMGTAEEFEKFVVPGEPVPSGKIGIKRFYFGADWGYSIDPTVLVRCFIHDRTLYVDYEVYEVGCEVDHRPLLFAGFDDPEVRRLNPHAFQNLVVQKQRLWLGIPQARKWPIIADSSSPDVISYMKRHGPPRVPSASGLPV